MFISRLITLSLSIDYLLALDDKLRVNIVLGSYMAKSNFQSVFGKLTDYFNITNKLEYVYDEPVTKNKVNILLSQKDGLIDTSNSSNILFIAHQSTEPICEPNIVNSINLRNLDYQGIFICLLYFLANSFIVGSESKAIILTNNVDDYNRLVRTYQLIGLTIINDRMEIADAEDYLNSLTAVSKTITIANYYRKYEEQMKIVNWFFQYNVKDKNYRLATLIADEHLTHENPAKYAGMYVYSGYIMNNTSPENQRFLSEKPCPFI